MATLCCFGDSITWGDKDDTGGWVLRVRQHVEAELADGFCDVYNCGVKGDTAADVHDRITPELAARQGGGGTGIILQVGTNDALRADGERWTAPDAFRASLDRLVWAAQEAADIVAVLDLLPVDDRVDPIPWHPGGRYLPDDIATNQEIVADVCRERGVDRVAFHEAFAGREAELLADGVHPNEAGHRLIADRVAAWLDEESVVARLVDGQG